MIDLVGGRVFFGFMLVLAVYVGSVYAVLASSMINGVSPPSPPFKIDVWFFVLAVLVALVVDLFHSFFCSRWDRVRNEGGGFV